MMAHGNDTSGLNMPDRAGSGVACYCPARITHRLTMWQRETVGGCLYGDRMTDTPWEPPLAGTEAEHVLGALDRLRATFRWKADGLDAAGLHARVGASALTIGGLLKHLARVEDEASGPKLSGAPRSAPWDTAPLEDSDEWEFSSAAEDRPEDLYALYDEAVARSRKRFTDVARDDGLDRAVHLEWPGRGHFSLRRLLCDLIEEYGRHTGHADLIREAVDGRVGEDPPRGWVVPWL
jgi:hypothetical protein